MNIVSLFSGCGGLDLGFEKAGFNIIWANEFDKTIHDTYKINHPKTYLNTSDVRTIKGSDIPECDGIIGGPPCQSWSEGGKRMGLDDPRGKLFLEYIRIVKEKQPKFFLIENVKGILEERHKKSFLLFLKLLENAGYKVSYELLNAADYKIPQDRFRVFFVGIRNDLNVNFEFPNACNNSIVTLKMAIGDIVEEPRLFKDELIVSDNPTRLNHDVYYGPYDEKYMARNRVRSWDEVSYTIQAQARNTPIHPQAPKMTFISSNRRIFVKGYERLYRRLSVRECARIQSFPDDFKFLYSKIENGYKMVGNAVPPRLARFLAIQIKDAFKDNEDNKLNKNDLLKNSHISIVSIAKQNKFFLIDNDNILYNIKQNNKLLDNDNPVLISLVKSDTVSYFTKQKASIYYTGKSIPTNLDFHNVLLFFPYIKGKGIKDLYVINKIRFGTKKELHKTSKDDSLRIIFEIKFLKQFFRDYIPVHLNIWHTFTLTTMETMYKYYENEGDVIGDLY